MKMYLPSLMMSVISFVKGEISSQSKTGGGLMDQPPFLGSYQIEDSCQFNLCGPDYSEEFTGGSHSSPRVGSCSGDCHLLATNLNSNKFHREFLWSNCARMCSDKFDFSQYKLYKPRFVCMEKCYSSYKALAPHHSLARYCIKASCPRSSSEKLHQLDCFTSCSKHVTSRVAETDWKRWASALAGQCQGGGHQGGMDRLSCADQEVWTHISTSEGVTSMSPVSTLCLSNICSQDIKCARNCLAHVQAVQEDLRSVWTGCSKSVKCLNISNSGERLECADRCLEERRESERENERKRQELEQEEKKVVQEQRRQQALLSVDPSGGAGHLGVRTLVLCIVGVVWGLH